MWFRSSGWVLPLPVCLDLFTNHYLGSCLPTPHISPGSLRLPPSPSNDACTPPETFFFFPQKRINATLAPRIILLGLLEWGAIAFSEKEEVAWFKFLICQLSAVMTLDKVL